MMHTAAKTHTVPTALRKLKFLHCYKRAKPLIRTVYKQKYFNKCTDFLVKSLVYWKHMYSTFVYTLYEWVLLKTDLLDKAVP